MTIKDLTIEEKRVLDKLIQRRMVEPLEGAPIQDDETTVENDDSPITGKILEVSEDKLIGGVDVPCGVADCESNVDLVCQTLPRISTRATCLTCKLKRPWRKR